MQALDYQKFQDHEVFARYASKQIASWPIDFMFVADDILQAMQATAVVADFGSCKVKVPSINHMIALKLHALKQGQKHREDKDLIDVKKLVELGEVDLKSFRQLCERYDRIDVYEKFKGFCA